MFSLKVIFITFIIALASYMAGSYWFITSLPTNKISLEGNNLAKDVDALVAFTGGTQRIADALGYLEKNHGKALLITGVHPSVTLDKLAYKLSEEIKSRIELDYEALSTKGNVAVTLGWAKANGYKKIGLVTGYYHVPRSVMLFDRTDSDIEIISIPAFPEVVPPSYLFREYNKYLLTKIGML